MNDWRPPEMKTFGISVESWNFLSKLSLSELEEVAEIAKERIERKQYERLKAKFEAMESEL